MSVVQLPTDEFTSRAVPDPLKKIRNGVPRQPGPEQDIKTSPMIMGRLEQSADA